MDLPPVTPPDVDARRAAVAHLDALGGPPGGLGRLAELGCWLAAVQGGIPPRPPARPRVVAVAADHGIAGAGVSAHPAEHTAALVAAVRDNTAPLAVLAPVAGVSVRLVDVGLAAETPGADPGHRVRAGSGRIDRADALTPDEVDRAVAVGRLLADEEVDAGADLLLPAAIGVGSTTPAAVLVAALLVVEPVAVVGRGSGIDDQGWMRKAVAVRDALRRSRPHGRDPLALLGAVGGADVAVLTGLLAQAALRRTPVLLDGPVPLVAALLADELAPGAKAWWRLAAAPAEPAARRAADHLGLDPVLDLDLRIGDGTGAVAVVPLLRMAARLLSDAAAPR